MSAAAVNPTPNGCVIGLAEEIAQAIARCEYGKKKNRFAVLVWSSFKQAGWQKGPEAGLRYFFDMDAVCLELKTTPRSLANMRHELEQDGLFRYIPNKENYRTGWIVWNPAYHDWLPLQPNALRHGGKRTGAGNPNWKASNRTLLDSTEQQSLSSGVRPVGKTLSSGVRQPAITPFKRCTLPSLEAAPAQAAIVESKKGTEEEYTEEYMRANAAHIEQGQLLPIVPQQDTAKSASGSKKERKRDALWDKAVDLFNYQPKGGEVWYWRKAMKQMREDSVTPEALESAAQRYKREHPDWRYSFKAVFEHLGELLTAPAAPVVGLASNYRMFDGPAWRKPQAQGGAI